MRNILTFFRVLVCGPTHHTDYEITPISRDRWRYCEDDKSLSVYKAIEWWPTRTYINFDHGVHWDTPHENEEIDQEHKKLIIKRFAEYCEEVGAPAIIDLASAGFTPDSLEP